ncbi:TPA: hypothetical protein ACUB6Y_001967 [Raoultella ornithinolytica]|uniref:hypothetical protein n=1 Tax=Raoultella ornithinolytica TaxID=54291 RepID=UPI001F29C07F|nr:hypothetical protein [Raoultella ornithinolytica]
MNAKLEISTGHHTQTQPGYFRPSADIAITLIAYCPPERGLFFSTGINARYLIC